MFEKAQKGAVEISEEGSSVGSSAEDKKSKDAKISEQKLFSVSLNERSLDEAAA